MENTPNLDYFIVTPQAEDESFDVIGKSLYPDAEMSHDLGRVALPEDIVVSELPNLDY